jgi:hypothetical protein
VVWVGGWFYSADGAGEFFCFFKIIFHTSPRFVRY